MADKAEKPVAPKPDIDPPMTLSAEHWHSWLSALGALYRFSPELRVKVRFYLLRYARGDRSTDLYLAIYDADGSYSKFFA